jgi:WD40 repeat protein
VEFYLERDADCCHFSPDGRCIAVAALSTIYLWDITGPEPCLIQALTGHTGDITSLIFSSSLTLISASLDGSVKFWQISASSLNPTIPDSKPIPLTPTSISSVCIKSKDGLAFSINTQGVVRIWNILTGLCEGTTETPAQDAESVDIQVISGGLAITWYKVSSKSNTPPFIIYFWDIKGGASTYRVVDMGSERPNDLRISEDGTRVTYTINEKIQTWSTEKLIDQEPQHVHNLHMDNSKVSVGRPHLNSINVRGYYPVRIEDSITGKEIFQLHGKYANPSSIKWDWQYLVAGYQSGEVLVLDFSQMLAQ